MSRRDVLRSVTRSVSYAALDIDFSVIAWRVDRESGRLVGRR